MLRLGGNTDHQRERIVAEFEKQKPVSEIAASLQALYHGGNGITTNTGSITAWYTEEGIRLSRGKSARYDKSSLGRVPLRASGNFWNPASLPPMWS